MGNVAYFNTHSYEPFQLMDYLDPNVNVGRGNGTYTLDEQRAYLRFLNLDRPIYNLHLDGLVNDDTDPLHADSALFFKIEATDEANSGLNTFGTWQVGTQAPRTHTISLDLTGKVGTLTLTASGYSSTYAQYPVAITVTGITAKHTPAVGFLGAALWGGLSGVAGVVRASPASGLWKRRWLAGNLCDRGAALVLGLVLAAFVVVVPFWEPGNTGLATESYNTAYWDGESTVSFVYQQYGALAHSLLNGRLDLEEDPPAALAALDNPYDPTARSEAQVEGGRWDHAYYNGRYYVYFGIVPCLLFQLPFEAITGIQNLAYAPCMVVLGLIFLLSCFGVMGQVVRRWFPRISSAAYLLSVAALMLGSQLYNLLERPYIYEYVIVCGAALLLLGLWLWLAAAATPVVAGRLADPAAGTGEPVCGAGGRVPSPDGTVRAAGRCPSSGTAMVRAGDCAAGPVCGNWQPFALPVVLVAAGLMWYNAARFGSPFDFGANYNITGNDMTRRGFNVVRIGPAVFTSLLDLPRAAGCFSLPAGMRTCRPMRSSAPSVKNSPAACWGPPPSPGRWPWRYSPGHGAVWAARRGAAGIVWGAMAATLVITVVDCRWPVFCTVI